MKLANKMNLSLIFSCSFFICGSAMEPTSEYRRDSVYFEALKDHPTMTITITGMGTDEETPAVGLFDTKLNLLQSRPSNHNMQFEFEFDYEGEIYIFHRPTLISLGRYLFIVPAIALKYIRPYSL